MEFLMLLALCVTVVLGVAWFGRRRTPMADDAGLAAKANAEAERRKNDWYGGTG